MTRYTSVLLTYFGGSGVVPRPPNGDTPVDATRGLLSPDPLYCGVQKSLNYTM